MNKKQKSLAMEIINEKQADQAPEKLPTVVVTTVKTLIVLIDVTKIFTNDHVDEILDRLASSLHLFINEAGV